MPPPGGYGKPEGFPVTGLVVLSYLGSLRLIFGFALSRLQGHTGTKRGELWQGTMSAETFKKCSSGQALVLAPSPAIEAIDATRRLVKGSTFSPVREDNDEG